MAFSISDGVLEEIKGRVDLTDLISSYGVQVRRAGADYKACCPFHHEKTPSFVIHPERGFYHCFGCGESGDAVKFVMKQEGLTFVEAVKKLAQQCGIKIEESHDPQAGLRKRLHALHAELAQFYRRCLKLAPEADAARKYLASRDLTDEIAEKFCIGYAPLSPEAMVKWAQKYGFSLDEMDQAGVLLKSKYEGGRPYHRFGGRLMFTIRDRAGRPVAFSGRILTNDKKAAKYVNSPETPIFRKSNILFALDQAAPNIVKAAHREAIVCEGQIDVIRCHASGFPTAVASQGTAFTAEHVQILKKCADSVTLVFDADGAGRKAAIRTGGEFLAAEVPVRVATLPAGEDPDSLLRTQGAAAFQQCLDASESIISFLVRVKREEETNPGSIDAVTRVSRAVLEMLAHCPSAIMRASLMAEAARLLELPISALESDLANRPSHSASKPSKPVDPPPKTVPPLADAAEPPEDFYIDSTPPEGLEDELNSDAASPVNNPPPPCENALCELLIDNEGCVELLPLVRDYLPDQVLRHEFSRKVVDAWRQSVDGAEGAFTRLRAELPKAEVAWLDKMMLGAAKASLSELPLQKVLQDMLRQIWVAAVRERQGAMPAASTPENDAIRLGLSLLVRKLQRSPWVQAAKLMKVEKLERWFENGK